MSALDKDNLDEFLEELGKLCIQYRLRIGGCGCCGSPHLSELDAIAGTYKCEENGDYLCNTLPAESTAVRLYRDNAIRNCNGMG